ncbi:MAG: class I SAM-dependent methyltransferase [Candidatus Latescibacterota bacterium]
MKQTPTSSLLDRAESWAAALWEASRGRWPEREGQDRNYRAHVVHPAIRAAFREYCPARNFRLLDLGCGDGAFLDDPANRELLRSGEYLGVDVSGELVGKASEKHHGPGCRFTVGNLADRETVGRLSAAGGPRDCALTVFVIQEMPDLGSFLGNLSGIMKPGAIALMVTVHPDFAEWLRDSGAMPLADELAGTGEGDGFRWRWAGRYPIVDEPREPFYLPYFHRSESDYRDAFGEAGFAVREVREIPLANELTRLRAQGISPFLPFETNVYWPRIAEGPSGMILIAQKEEDHG